MIKSITLKNFFSFEEQTVRLNPKVNLLVGINGSGKSNFIKAFELLRFGINEGTVSQKIEHWGGEHKVIRFSNEKIEQYGISIRVTHDSFTKNNSEEFLYAVLTKENSDGYLNLYETAALTNKEEKNILFNAPLSYTQLLNIQRITGNETLEMFEHYIKQIVVYEQIDISENGVRKENRVLRNGLEEKLSVNFDNLASLIYSFKRKPETKEVFDKIQSTLTKVNVNLGDIQFKARGEILEMYINDRRKDLLMGLESISSGTLKFLTLMSILYNPNRGTIVCIEEPEDGLHPDMINTVAEGIKYAAQDSQMIISTHSPFLLNAFELEDILIFENDKNNNTVVTELSQKDFGEWKHDFTAGQAWLNGLIGGTRW